MADARIKPNALAARVGVAGKTVSRWLADAEMVPRAETRQAVAAALKVEEDMLWPKAVSDRVKVGQDRELVHSYAYRSACPSTVWADLVHGTRRELVLSGYTNYFFWTTIPDFAGVIRRKVEDGCRVRFLLGDPEGEITRQREVIEAAALTVSTRIRITLEHLAALGPLDGLETRFSDPSDAVNHVGLSVFRFDDDALVTPHLARVIGHDSPLMHLRRRIDGGMFDRFRDHTEELWSRGVGVDL